MDKSKELGTENIGKLLFKFSIPAIIGMVVNALYNIVDRMYIGHIGNGVGEKALTGVGITMPISMIIMAFGMLIGVGASTLVSIKLGEKNNEAANKILNQALILTIIISVIISIIGLVSLNSVLYLFGADSESIIYAKEYISIIIAGTVLQNIGFGLNNIIRSEGNPRIAMRTMLVGAILNTVLDPFFIYDFGLGLGIRGAAIATVISQAANSLLVIYHFTSKNSGSILKFKNISLNLDKSIIKSIVSIGLSPFVMQIASSAVSTLYNRGLLFYGGNTAVAAMSIISSISTMIFMPIFGINQGVQPILGYNYGAKAFTRVKEALKLAIAAGVALASVGFVFVQFFPNILFSAFAKDAPNLVELGSKGIKIDLMFLPIVGYQIVASNYFQSVGKANISIFLSFLRQIIVLIPIIIILPKFLGLNGLWFSQPIADIFAAILTSFFLIREMKQIKDESNTQKNYKIENNNNFVTNK